MLSGFRIRLADAPMPDYQNLFLTHVPAFIQAPVIDFVPKVTRS